MTDEQLQRLERDIDPVEFDVSHGVGRTIREYCDEYSYRQDLYIDLCSDFGLDPEGA